MKLSKKLLDRKKGSENLCQNLNLNKKKIEMINRAENEKQNAFLNNKEKKTLKINLKKSKKKIWKNSLVCHP